MSTATVTVNDDLEAAWAPLRRSSPDPAAPNVPSLPVRLLLTFFTSHALLATLLVVLPYSIVRYYTTGPPCAWQPLQTYLGGRLVYWSGRLSDAAFLRPPPPTGEVPSNLPLKWAKEGRAGVDVTVVTIPPVPDSMQRGIGRVQGVEAQERPGFMLTPPKSLGKGTEAAKDGEKVVLYFHGGAYGGGQPVKFPFPWQITKAINSRLLGVQYRLCVSAETAFPAPLLDALGGYIYLTQTLHFEPQNIILLGDSSGAHLVLTLSRYLFDLGLPQAGYIALSSPLGDCSRSMPSRKNMKGIDILASNMDAKPLKSALRHYSPQAVDHPYFAPAKAGGGGWKYLKAAGTRVYIMIGTKEVLMDDGFGIVKGMKEAGVDVMVREDQDGNHCGAMAQWKGSDAWDVWVRDLSTLITD